MAHIYLLFDFAKDEEKAQQARHKLENWKQAFRLDKRLLYKFERSEESAASSGDGEREHAPHKSAAAKTETSAKAAKGKGKGKTKAEGKSEEVSATEEGPPSKVKLLVRLAFSNHEKLSEQRWVDRILAEEPFRSAAPELVRADDTEFEATEKRFEELV